MTRLPGQARGHTAPHRQMSSFLSRFATSLSLTQGCLLAISKLEGSIQMCVGKITEQSQREASELLFCLKGSGRCLIGIHPMPCHWCWGQTLATQLPKAASLALASRGNYGNKSLVRTILLILPAVTGCVHARDRKY